MMAFASAVPNAGSLIGDLIAKNMDWPGADEIAERLKKALPPGIVEPEEGEEDPAQQAAAEAAQQAAQAQQQIAEAESAKAVAETAATAAKAAKLEAETEKVEAETAKVQIEVILASGEFQNAIGEVVAGAIERILTPQQGNGQQNPLPDQDAPVTGPQNPVI